MIKNRQQNFLLNQQISFCSVSSIGPGIFKTDMIVGKYYDEHNYEHNMSGS